MIHPLSQDNVPIRGRPAPPPPVPDAFRADFRAILHERLERTPSVRFSAHAAERLERRSIALSPGQMASIDRALSALAAKGSHESLVLLGSTALVVSVPNRTVITAVSTHEMPHTLFTQIDSAVVLGEDPEGTASLEHGPVPLRGGLHAADRLTRRTSDIEPLSKTIEEAQAP